MIWKKPFSKIVTFSESNIIKYQIVQGTKVIMPSRISLLQKGGNLAQAKLASYNTNKQGGVSHCGLAIYIKKYLKAKEEELWKLKYFTMQKYINLQKIL